MNWEILIIAAVMLFFVHQFFDLKNLLNPFVFFYLYQTFFCFIALSYNDLLYPQIAIDPILRNYIVVSYILTFSGAFLSRWLFAKAGIKYVRINDITIKNRPSKKFQMAGLAVFFLGILTFILFTYKTGGIILFAEDIENERITRKAGAGLANLIFISFLLYGYAVVLLSFRRHFVIKTIFFVFTAFALISYGSRAPLLKLIITTFVIVLILSNRKISFKQLTKVGIVLFLLLAILEAYRSNFSGDVSFIRLSALRLSWRPFVNIQNVQRIYDFFPDHNEFLMGESYLIDLKLFLPGSNPNFGTYLKDMMNWEFDGGSITTTFIGLGYLNFGKIAFILYPLFYGFIFNSIYQLILYKPQIKNYPLLFLIFLSIGVSGSVSTGLFGTLINNVLFLFLALITHAVLCQFLSKRPTKFKLE